MSHFTVLVIGESPGGQLAPYQENNCNDCLQQYLKYKSYPKDGTDSQWFESEEEAKAKLGDNFNPEDSFWENPNKKWDWYKLGGRWTGFFKLKSTPDALLHGRRGEPGLMTESAKIGFADQCRLKDIDIEGMKDAAAKKASEKYDKIMAIIGDKLDNFIPWPDFVCRAEAKEITWEDARKIYNSQKARKALNCSSDRNLSWEKIEDFLFPKDEFIQQARDGAITTFAVIKDGQWYQRGEMGWWACVSDEKTQDNWSQEFSQLLDSLSGDTLLSLYDCHI